MADFKSKLSLDYLSSNRSKGSPGFEESYPAAMAPELGDALLVTGQTVLVTLVGAGANGIRIHSLVDELGRPLSEIRPLLEYFRISGYAEAVERDALKGNDLFRATGKAQEALGKRG